MHLNYLVLTGSIQVNHSKVLIFHIFFLFFLLLIWGGWSIRITGNTQIWQIFSSNPTDGLGQDGPGNSHYEAPDNLQVGHVECVFCWQFHILYFFFCISKVSSMLNDGSMEWFHSKERYLNRVHHLPLSAARTGLWTSNQVFKKGELDRTSTFRGDCW